MNLRRIIVFIFPAIGCLFSFYGLIGCSNFDKRIVDKDVTGISKYKLIKNWPQLPNGFVLGNPTGIGIDTNQNIFVFIRAGRAWSEPMPDSTISAKTVLMLDRNSGKILNSWGADFFIMPHGLTVDKNNNIWVTDVALQQVFKFNHDGKLLMKLGEAKVAGNDSTHFNLPTDVAVAVDGSFYVSDGYGNNRIVKFSSTGKYLFEWGSKGDKPGEFNLPHGIDVDAKGNVYVADRENNRIQQFDFNGKFLNEWSSDSFGKMYSLAIDKSKNNLVAIDYLTMMAIPKGSNIIIFDSTKQHTTLIGRSGLYDGTVCRYHDVAIDNEGSIYVGDILGNRIQKFKKTSP
ncbi:MAG: peptidyl-alpha-hydroxyglycine alpha-amidating lyase family protein [Bacteroidia bacterium]